MEGMLFGIWCGGNPDSVLLERECYLESVCLGGNGVLFLSGRKCLGCFGKGMLVGERSLVWICQGENASWDPLGRKCWFSDVGLEFQNWLKLLWDRR